MANDNLTERVYFTAEAAEAAARLPKLTADLPLMVKSDLTFKLGNKGFQIVQNLRAARDAASKAEKDKKVAQALLNNMFPDAAQAYGAVGLFRGVKAAQIAYGTAPATVDLETLKIAFPEAYAATVTSAKRFTYWK